MAERVDHGGTGVSLAVPDGWHVVHDPGPGVTLMSVEPPQWADGPGLFRANLVVTSVPSSSVRFCQSRKSDHPIQRGPVGPAGRLRRGTLRACADAH